MLAIAFSMCEMWSVKWIVLLFRFQKCSVPYLSHTEKLNAKWAQLPKICSQRFLILKLADRRIHIAHTFALDGVLHSIGMQHFRWYCSNQTKAFSTILLSFKVKTKYNIAHAKMIKSHAQYNRRNCRRTKNSDPCRPKYLHKEIDLKFIAKPYAIATAIFSLWFAIFAECAH